MSFIQEELTIEQMIGITTATPTPRELLIQIYRQFYAGTEDVKLSSRQQDYLISGDGVPNAISNMCELVVTKIKNRTKVMKEGKGIQSADDNSEDFAKFAKNEWITSNLDMEQSELMTYILRDGEACLMEEWNGAELTYNAKPVYDGKFYDGEGGVRFHRLDPRNEFVNFASYRWEVPVYNAAGDIEQTYVRLNLYVPGDGDNGAEVYRYQSVSSGEDWQPLTDEEVEMENGSNLGNPETLDTPFIIPRRFTNSNTESEIRAIMKLEQLRQKSLLDVDMAADFHGMPTMSADDIDYELDEQQKPKPKVIQPGYWVQALNAKRIEGADLKLMWEGTLRPYLMEVGLLKNFPVWMLNPRDNSVPSGTALKVQERDFVSMIQDKQDKLTVQWQEVFFIAREYANLAADVNYPEDSRLSFVWVNPATESVIEDRRIEVETANLASLSDETIWRKVYGYDNDQVKEERTRRQQDTDVIKEQAEIIDLLVKATFNADGAISVAGFSDEASMALRLFGNDELGISPAPGVQEVRGGISAAGVGDNA